MTTAVDALAAPARLNVAVERLASDDATITDVRAVLHLLANSNDVDAMRTQALLALASRALGRFSTQVLYAPPAALNELVRDSEAPCKAAHLGCIENVVDWQGDYCSVSCELSDGRTRP